MSRDVSNERSISLSEAAKLLPTRPHLSTLCRWSSVGVRGVRLESTLIGGRRVTTKESVDRFLRSLNGSGKTKCSK